MQQSHGTPNSITPSHAPDASEIRETSAPLASPAAPTIPETRGYGDTLRADIRARAVEEAEYILSSGATVRGAAKAFDVSKSTVHKDVTERLGAIDPLLAAEVKKVLDFNLSERHLRGGESTRRKYGRAERKN